MASQHIDPRGQNQFNPGIGIEANGWVVGEFKNSGKRTSIYAGRQLFLNSDEHIKVGVAVGAMTGYQRWVDGAGIKRGSVPGFLAPLVSPFISYEGDRVGVNVTFQPNPSEPSKSAFGFQLKLRF